MSNENLREKALELVNASQFAMVGSNSEEGFPSIKAMIKIEAEGLKRVYFSTNTSSKRVAQFRANPKASLYFTDFEIWAGLLLIGTMEVLEDPELKERFWFDGCEKYYPLGVTDPDYCILRFTARQGNYYHALSNTTFEI